MAEVAPRLPRSRDHPAPARPGSFRQGHLGDLDVRTPALTSMRVGPDCGTFADRPRDARSPEEPGRAQFPYAPPAAFTGTRAANGDVNRLTSLVLGRFKAETVSTFERVFVVRLYSIS